jgi:hypothetical protein
MSTRLLAAALWMALVALALASVAVGAQDNCEPGPSVVIVTPLYFGGIWVREGGAGAVVVSLRGGVTSVGDVMTDGRAEIGRMTVCGDAGSQLYLTITPRQPDPADAHAVATHRVRDFEVQATGAVIERAGENTWLLTLGARGRGALTVGGTLVMSPFVVRGTVVQAFIVSVVTARPAVRSK